MIRTKSEARTQTNTRIEFILNHFRSALNRLTNYDHSEIEKILRGIRNEEIESLDFIGYVSKEDKKDVYVRLQLSVDWDEHHQLRKEQPQITYDNKFDEGNCPEVYGLIMVTQKTINDKKLESNVLFGYTQRVRKNSTILADARKKYRTSPTSLQYDYSKLKYSECCNAPEVPELYAKCDLSD